MFELVNDRVELSPYAQVFYTEWLLNPKDSRYNMTIDQVLHGTLDVNRLKIALTRYVVDHAILRAHVREIDGIAYWEINDKISELEYTDTCLMDEELLTFVKQSFDLQHGPLYRFKLIKLDTNIHRIILVFHHIVVDGASTDKGIFDEISNYYNGDSYSALYSINKQIKLMSELSKALTDIAINNKNENHKFWDKLLVDVEPVDLRFLKSNLLYKEKLTTEDNKEIRFAYNIDKIEKLNRLKREFSVTPYIFGQCILAILLFRYTNQRKIAISYPIAIKEGADFIYGAQINNTLIVYEFNDDITILDLFNQTKGFIKSLKQKNINHKYYPITYLLNDKSKHLVDVSYVQANFKEKKFEFEGLDRVEVLNKLNIDIASVLSFEHELKDNTLNYRVKYNQQIINRELLDNFVDDYKRVFIAILEDMLQSQNDKIISYFSLDKKQFQKVVYEYNQTYAKYPSHKTVHQLFQEQVCKTPESIALINKNISITYSELNAYANRLAKLIFKYNINPNDLVAILLNRSHYVVIAMFAVLKAGGAYVPIDNKYPNERIINILNDIDSKVVITDEQNYFKLKSIKCKTIKKIIVIDYIFKNMSNNLYEDNLYTTVSSNDLAYVIYTSGTTGTPKGVMVEHKNIVNFITGFQRAIFSKNSLLSTISTTNYTFDIFNLEYLLPLVNGYSVELMDLMENEGKIYINQYGFIQLTPSKLDLLLPRFDYLQKNASQLNSQKVKFIIGGEQFNTATLNSLTRLKQKLSCYKTDFCWEVINVYGPTEATVWSSFKNINNSEINIGLPLPNQMLYVLDKNLEPLPVGVIGELYIGGEGVARGYLNHKGYTNTVFKKNPFYIKENNYSSEKVYKTGDLARRLLNGEIEYVGRSDSQVKLRGYRIDLNEIEHTVLELSTVKQAIAVLHNQKNTPKDSLGKYDYIVLYYTSDYLLDERTVFNHLVKYLPEYLLPNVLMRIEEMPLTNHGKIDRNALPHVQNYINVNYIKPRNEQEILICKAFSKILGIKKIGINDDFFRCGGNSMQAISLTSILQSKFDVHVSDIFNLRTPANLAQYLPFGKNFIKKRLIRIKAHIDKNPSCEYDNMLIDKLKNYRSKYNSLRDINYTNKSIKNILLTGATGYLGCNILNQLLIQTNYNIYLLVRADTLEDSIKRVYQKFKFYFNKSLEGMYKDRVIIFNSDIEDKSLGLTVSDYKELTNKIDSVIHSAALVKHYGEYEKFYSANVQATVNLLEFTKQTRLKDFHYISTYSVLQFGHIPNHHSYAYVEDDVPTNLKHWYNGYLLTKFKGEIKTIEYREQGIKSNIYRVGNLAFMHENYRIQENLEENAFIVWLKCIFALKCTTQDINLVEISPVDLTAEAIVKLFDKSELVNSNYHVFNPQVYNLANIINDKSVLSIVSNSKFIDKIINNIDADTYKQLIMRFLLRQGWLEEFTEMPPQIEVLQDKTNYILKQLGFDWSVVTSTKVKNFLDLVSNLLHESFAINNSRGDE